jgi:hypothetical protein
VKDSRAGETLWSEWDGRLHFPSSENSILFYTIGHVDISNEIVKRALSSALQREGLVDSLGEGFRSVENAIMSFYGHCGYVDSDTELTSCDMYGETDYGDIVDEIFPVTWIEISVR